MAGGGAGGGRGCDCSCCVGMEEEEDFIIAEGADGLAATLGEADDDAEAEDEDRSVDEGDAEAAAAAGSRWDGVARASAAAALLFGIEGGKAGVVDDEEKGSADALASPCRDESAEGSGC